MPVCTWPATPSQQTFWDRDSFQVNIWYMMDRIDRSNGMASVLCVMANWGRKRQPACPPARPRSTLFVAAKNFNQSTHVLIVIQVSQTRSQLHCSLWKAGRRTGGRRGRSTPCPQRARIASISSLLIIKQATVVSSLCASLHVLL